MRVSRSVFKYKSMRLGFAGDFSSYLEDKKRRLGPEAVEPKKLKFKKFQRD